jgi:hypothetical protein
MIIFYLKAIININEDFEYDFKDIRLKKVINNYF